MCNKANRKLFILRKIRESGFNKSEQLHAYITYIRPHLEYCSIVWGTGLNDKLSYKIERIQKRAFSIIERKKVDRDNYQDVLESNKLESLSSRRVKALINFGEKIFTSKRFRHFLPEIVDESTQRTLRYRKNILYEPNYKNERYKSSTIPAIISYINKNYIENGTVFSWSREQALLVQGYC